MDDHQPVGADVGRRGDSRRRVRGARAGPGRPAGGPRVTKRRQKGPGEVGSQPPCPLRIVLDPRKLRDLMAERGLSQMELHRRSGIIQQNVNRLCNLKIVRPPSMDTLARLVVGLGLTSVDPLLTYHWTQAPPAE